MKKGLFVICLTLFCIVYRLNAQNNSMVVYNYDADGNRTSLNYILTRVDDKSISNDTVGDVTASSPEEPDYSVTVYPNPTSGYLVLSSNSHGDMPKTNARLYSLQGNVVEEKVITSDRTEFNLSDYPAGVYFLEIICDNERQLWKIIKK